MGIEDSIGDREVLAAALTPTAANVKDGMPVVSTVVSTHPIVLPRKRGGVRPPLANARQLFHVIPSKAPPPAKETLLPKAAPPEPTVALSVDPWSSDDSSVEAVTAGRIQKSEWVVPVRTVSNAVAGGSVSDDESTDVFSPLGASGADHGDAVSELPTSVAERPATPVSESEAAPASDAELGDSTTAEESAAEEKERAASYLESLAPAVSNRDDVFDGRPFVVDDDEARPETLTTPQPIVGGVRRLSTFVVDDDVVAVPATRISRSPAVRSAALPAAIASRQTAVSLNRRRTMIPVLLTLGICLPLIGVGYFAMPEESSFKLIDSTVPIALIGIGPIFLFFALLNMLQVRAALRR